MSVESTKSLTPFEQSQLRAIQFQNSMLYNAALTETLKVLEDMRLQGKELLAKFKASEGPKKEEYKQAISLHIQDSKFLLETIFMNPLEKDV